MRIKPYIFGLVILVIAPAFGQQSAPTHHEITGRVVGITDGDTLTLLTPENRQVKVRLVDIDAPEHNQPHGDKAKQALSDLAFDKEARIVDQGTDKYGRTLGRVYVGPTDVNAALVTRGVAWVYRQYSHDPHLLQLEAFAKNSHQGLWALPESQRVPPWEWRHGGEPTTVETPMPAPVAPRSVASPVPSPITPAPVSEPMVRKDSPTPYPAIHHGESSEKSHYVHSYTRKDGTVVRGYYRH